MNLETMQHIQAYLFAIKNGKASGLALDIGCGIGYGTKMIANSKKWNCIYAINNNPDIMKLTKNYRHETISYQKGNICLIIVFKLLVGFLLLFLELFLQVQVKQLRNLRIRRK